MTGRDDSTRPSFITARPVAILMVFLAAVVFGYLSLDRLPVTLMPELTYPTITIRTEYPGAAPEEVENDISRPIEEQLGVISGLARLSSVSRAGVSDVVLEFAWDTDMSEATQNALEKLDLVFLPDDAERPLILHFDPSLDPVMEISLSGSGQRFEGESGLRRLRRLAELRIKKDLEPVRGVAAVRIRGGLEEEIHVALEEEALRRTGISIQQVIDRLAQENINVAGGTLKEGRIEYLVRTLNEYGSLPQIRDTIVARFEGRDVRIRDLGSVEISHKEREIVTRTDGDPSVQVEIYKEGDANIVALAQRVKSLLGTFDPAAAGGASSDDAKGLAQRVFEEEGIRISVVSDRSLFIESSIREVFQTAVLGGLLAIVILYLFLQNALSTAIVAVSIPISLLITFAPLNLLGVTLNIMSLGGLALGVGMLVDSSIVVLESIYRCREEGDERGVAAVRGTAEVRAAVIASTLTSIAVFFPMVFVEGIAGQAFGDLGFAVVVSLLASAAVAIWFIPMLSNRAGLGLGVIFVVAAATVGVRLAFTQPLVAAAVVGACVVLLGAGFLFSFILIVTDRFELDPFGKRASGLARWAARDRVRPYLDDPLRTFRSWAARPRGAFGAVAYPFRFVAALFALVLVPIYVFVRFALGTAIEWLVAKPLLLAFLGAASLLVRIVVPALATVFRVLTWPLVKLTGWVLDLVGRAYPSVIRAALASPLLVFALVVLCLWGTWEIARQLDSELLPEVHQGEFTVEVSFPVGTPLEETEAILTPVERAILAHREHIESLILTLGYDSSNTQRSDEGEHTARFKVLLEPGDNLLETENGVVESLRRSFAGIPDLEARVVRPVLFSSKTPIEVEIYGDDLVQLRRVADEAAAAMGSIPMLADVESSLRSGAPEVQIVYDRDRLARYDLNIRTVAELVRAKVRGTEATKYNLKDRRIPIIVRLAIDDREAVEDVREIVINPGGARPIRLAAVARVTLGEGPSEVRRVDAQRVAVISANIAEGSLSAATEKIRAVLERRIPWPDTMDYAITGQNEEWQRSQNSLFFALALSIFLVYVIMAAQFESLIQPLVIMLTIPLAFVGTVVTLKLLGMSLSVVVFLGMIMLAGIVVNNAIVLVDYVNTLRARGLRRDEAVVQAGSVRLRPILMTTATTVLGLLPMALGLGDGAEIRAPMAVAVISGLVSSTGLTLVVIPSIYVLADRIRARVLGLPDENPAEGDLASGAVTHGGAS